MKSAGQSGGALPNPYLRALLACVSHVGAFPGRTLGVAALITAASLVYASGSVRMNSDDSTLLSQTEPFRLHYKELTRLFPELEETSLIVITSDSIDRAQDAQDELAVALHARVDLIDTLYAPGAEPFFEDHSLLYLDLDDLEDVIERLAEAQPALTALTEDPSLRGLFDELELSLDELEEGESLPPGFTRMANRLSDIGESMLAGAPRAISWADEFFDDDELVYRLIIVQGKKDFGERIATARLIDGIRSTAEELGLTPDKGVQVRLTGMVPLAHDEQESLQRGLALAGGISVTLLTLILGFGVRSLRIIAATLITLVASISWTTALAMLMVGEFNIISAAFAVLLIGLGVDFAIHIGLRYEEETRKGLAPVDALRGAAAGTGSAVSLCALTSALGFLSFVPTPYYGLGDLGIIAGGGMFVSLIASFTVFPAVLALMRPPTARHATRMPLAVRLNLTISRHAGVLATVMACFAIAAISLSLRTEFDFSTLSMRDPDSESMTTLRELQAEEIVTDYSATVLAESFEASEAVALELEALDEVLEVRPPTYYVPGDQETKLEYLADAAFFLETVLYPDSPLPPPSAAERLEAMEALRLRLAALPSGHDDDAAWMAARRLGRSLDALGATADPEVRAAELEALVVSDLEERIDWLRTALTVGPIDFDDLPSTLRARIVSAEGPTRVVVLPREDVSQVDALRRFVAAVASVAPEATGRPAVEAGIGRIVVTTFRIAIGLSLVCVGLVLLLALRSLLDTLLVLVPITLAAFFTTAVGVLIDIPFNMSNVVVIPLILGLGVDNGIHVYMRYRHDKSLSGLMESSTPRAVVLSALTTLAAFGSLTVSGHLGIRSMGMLLSVAVVSMIVCTLVVLPTLIELKERWVTGRGR
ncbi:MAG: MMPL family transporter [Deltaproteobacteria bacterium]|nr:MMPL family transporter [Deltaproteobacteria bacterium]MBW2383107.1 MMPL family transporter [Deltaproteobacteria bacterium]MBW2698041.1 MMPL family transporter [Deltaproteobacteria bacterium]